MSLSQINGNNLLTNNDSVGGCQTVTHTSTHRARGLNDK